MGGQDGTNQKGNAARGINDGCWSLAVRLACDSANDELWMRLKNLVVLGKVSTGATQIDRVACVSSSIEHHALVTPREWWTRNHNGQPVQKSNRWDSACGGSGSKHVYNSSGALSMRTKWLGLFIATKPNIYRCF